MQDSENRLQSMGLAFGELNARIARLAIGLGVSLESEADIARVMHKAHPASNFTHERRSSQSSVDTFHPGANPDRRVAHKMEELRGLLVLRYSVENQFVNDIGVDATRKILTDSESKLEREGFKPKADGIDLNRLFGSPNE